MEDLNKGAGVGIKITEAIAKHGFVNVAAGFFVLFSMGLMLFFVVKVNSSLEAQNEVSKEILEYLDEQRYNREQINRKESNPEQIKDLARLMYYYSQHQIMYEMEVIYKQNHIVDTGVTMDKIKRVIDNEFQERIAVLSNYAVKGKELSEFLNAGYNEETILVCKKNIYAKGGFSPKRLEKDLELLYTKMRGDFKAAVLSYK